MSQQPLPVLRGTLDALVLRALLITPMHGFAVSSWLEQRTAGDLLILDSALYQALYRLERQRLVVADWRVTDKGKRARYYTITARGRARLRTATVDWQRYASIVGRVLATPQSA